MGLPKDHSVNRALLLFVSLLLSQNSYALRDSGGFFTKAFFTPDEESIIFGTVKKCVYSMDAETGDVNWRFNTGSKVVGPPEVAEDGSIYLATNSRYMVKLNPQGQVDWKCRSGKPNQSQPLVVDERVYMTSLDGYVYAFDTTFKNGVDYMHCGKLKDGVTAPLVWKFPIRAPGVEKISASRFHPIHVGGGRLIVGGWKNGDSVGVHLIQDMGDHAVYLDYFPTEKNNEGVRIGATFRDGVLYFNSRRKVYALRVNGNSFEYLWEYGEPDGMHRSRPTLSVDGSKLYIGDREKGQLYILDTATGLPLHVVPTQYNIVSEITLNPNNGNIYFGHAGSGRYFFQRSGVDGSVITMFNGNDVDEAPKRRTFRSTAFYNPNTNTVTAGTKTGQLYFLDADDFSIQAKFDGVSIVDKILCKIAPSVKD